jgi:hypothetical protein
MSVVFFMRMRRVISSSVASPTLLTFYTLFHKLQDFRGKMFNKHKIRVLIFSTISFLKRFAFCKRLERDMRKKYVLVFM